MGVVGIQGKHYWCGFSSTARSVERISTTPRQHMGLARPSACIAKLRTVSVVVRPPCGLLGCVRASSPGSGAVGVSSHSRALRFVDASTRLHNTLDEVVLFGVLGRFDAALVSAASPGVVNCRGQRSAESRVPLVRTRAHVYYVHVYVHVYVPICARSRACRFPLGSELWPARLGMGQ
jgi:hypothetical protein